MLKKYQAIFSNLQKISDLAVILLSWFLSFYFRFYFLDKAEQGLEQLFFKLAIVNIIICFYYFNKQGLYKSQRFNSKINEILSVLKSNFFSFLTLIVVLYFVAPQRISRIHLIIYLSLSSFLLIFSRIIVRNILRNLRKKGINLRHVLLIGNALHLESYVSAVKKYKDCGVNIIGWHDSGDLAEKLNVKNITDTNLVQPDSIVVGYNAKDSTKLEQFLKENYNNTIPIKIIPDLTYSYLGYSIEDFAGIPLLDVNQPTFTEFELTVKRFFDLFATLIGVLLISPILLIISIAVKLSSPGPIFYGQKRIGKDGKVFKMWKFRSMKVATSEIENKEWSNKENPRKTKVGELLRKTSLDELPQLFNVLLGDMSLVGPRPEQPFFVNKFRHIIPGYMLKHKMRAGITGWAQINGWRGDTDLHKRIECDIYYIKNWSFLFDLKILILTFWKGFINKNAY